MRIHTSTVGTSGESRENESWKVRMKTGLKLAIFGGLRQFLGWRSIGVEEESGPIRLRPVLSIEVAGDGGGVEKSDQL
ncbi:unnamed protein product [Prunus armeniaca]